MKNGQRLLIYLKFHYSKGIILRENIDTRVSGNQDKIIWKSFRRFVYNDTDLGKSIKENKGVFICFEINNLFFPLPLKTKRNNLKENGDGALWT